MPKAVNKAIIRIKMPALELYSGAMAFFTTPSVVVFVRRRRVRMRGEIIRIVVTVLDLRCDQN